MKKILLGILAFALLAALTAIGAFAAETVIYENDFSDPATLSDFKQYRTEWEIKDGGLFLTDKGTVADFDPKTNFSHIIYQGDALTDYIVEVDYMNIQTAGGIIFNADKDAAGNTVNGFYGYLAFISNDATKGALGCADEKGSWKGNIQVGDGGNCSMSSDVHIKVVVKGGYIHETIVNLANNKTVFDFTYKIGTNANDVKWVEGTVGLRMRSEFANNFAVSANNAYFDNFKLTTANEATIDSGSAGTGTTATTTTTSTAKAIDTSKLTAVYTQNFDGADALKDFTPYLGNWAVKDGKLYLTGVSAGSFSFLLFDGDENLTKLTDYVLDCDMYNTQTSAGPIVRSELDKVVGSSANGFAGYLGFVASDGKKFAVGTSKNDGDWDGNLNVGAAGTLTAGSNVHLQFAVKGDLIQLVATDLESGKELYSWSGKAGSRTAHSAGSFGFRMANESKANGLMNINTTAFDNLVISTYGAAEEPAQKTEVKLTIGSTTAYVNGEAKTLDVAPVIENSRTLMPLRFIAEAMGATVEWDGATSTATLTEGETKVVITLGSTTAYVNGTAKTLDAPAESRNGRTLLPVRFIAESFGAEVAWDGATSTATLTK